MNDDLRKRAMSSAYRMTLSPHEWTWTHTEQQEMATLILMQSEENEKLKKVAEAARATIDRQTDYQARFALVDIDNALIEAGEGRKTNETP